MDNHLNMCKYTEQHCCWNKNCLYPFQGDQGESDVSGDAALVQQEFEQFEFVT